MTTESPLHCFLSSFLIISIHSTYILTSQMHQIKPPSFTYTLLHQNPERTTLTQAPPTFPIIQNNLRKNFTPLLPSTPRYQQFQIHTNKSHQINKKFSIFIIIINKIKQKRLQGFPGTQNRTETLDYLQNQRHWITGQERTSRGWRGAGPLWEEGAEGERKAEDSGDWVSRRFAFLSFFFVFLGNSGCSHVWTTWYTAFFSFSPS